MLTKNNNPCFKGRNVFVFYLLKESTLPIFTSSLALDFLYPALLLLVQRFPDLDARVAVVIMRVLNVPHQSMLALPFYVLVEIGLSRNRF